MSNWKRPKDFDEKAFERAEQFVDEYAEEYGEYQLPESDEAFVAGALWAALLAEGRIE